MWNYLYLIVHLREKDPTEYNGWEQHVADTMAPRRMVRRVCRLLSSLP